MTYPQSRLMRISTHIFLPFISFDSSKVYVLFSDPRGGSTWLANVVANALSVPTVWEPLHLRYNPEIKKLGFDWRQYIPPNHEWPQAKKEFINILNGKRINLWSCSTSTINSFYQNRTALFKFCRGSALLPWFVNQLSFSYKPIYMVRHPFAVVASQIKQGGWNFEFKGFNFPRSSLGLEYYSPHREFLSRLETKEEALTATWAITNLVSLRSPIVLSKCIPLAYEKVYMEPWKSLESIASAWDFSMQQILTSVLNQASKVSIDFNGLDSASSKLLHLSKWKSFFSSAQIQRMQAILDYFEVDEYSKSSVYPIEKLYSSYKL